MSGMKNIGFVGLGKMGLPMVKSLKSAGFNIYIEDKNTAQKQMVHQQLAVPLLSVDTYPLIDVLITMLPDSTAVEAVILGEEGTVGLAQQLKASTIIIDMSSSDPVKSRALASTLSQLGLNYLDAPVSGGVKRAITGSLSVLVGGDKTRYEQCLPLFKAMGTSIHYIGTAGAGHAAKALNNYVSAMGLMATVEALHVAARFGIDVAMMTDVLNASTGKTNTSENKVKQFMLNGAYDSGFSMQLMNKDLQHMQGLSQSVGLPLTAGASMIATWDQISQQATPLTDHTQMYDMLNQ